jgi:hypothetical protein
MTDAQLKELESIEQLGKKTRKEVIEVTSDGSTFSIVDAYTKVLVDRGLNYGSMASDYPRALSFKAEYIAKWTSAACHNSDPPGKPRPAAPRMTWAGQ